MHGNESRIRDHHTDQRDIFSIKYQGVLMMLVDPRHGCTLVEVSDLIFFLYTKITFVHRGCTLSLFLCTMLLVYKLLFFLYKENFLCTRVSFCVQNKMNFDPLT